MGWHEGDCVSCGKPTDHIAFGWGICKQCRDEPVYGFEALYATLPSKRGRELVKREIKRHLPKEVA